MESRTPADDLSLKEPEKNKLYTIIMTLCDEKNDEKNLAFIEEKLPLFHASLDSARTPTELENIKLYCNKLKAVTDFFEQLIAYANSQDTFIDEKLENRIKTVIEKVNAIAEKYSEIARKLDAKDVERLKRWKAHGRSDTISEPTKDATELSELKKLDEALNKMENWLAVAANNLLKKNLLLQIIQNQLDVFDKDKNPDTHKMMKLYIGKITYAALIATKTRAELMELTKDFFVWQRQYATPISGLRATLPLHASIAFIMRALAQKDELKKYSGLHENGATMKKLMASYNTHRRDIDDLLLIDNRIKKHSKSLTSEDEKKPESKSSPTESVVKEPTAPVFIPPLSLTPQSKTSPQPLRRREPYHKRQPAAGGATITAEKKRATMAKNRPASTSQLKLWRVVEKKEEPKQNKEEQHSSRASRRESESKKLLSHRTPRPGKGSKE